MGASLAHRSDGFQFTCWNGDLIRGTFLVDAHDREIRSSGKRSTGSFSDPPHTWRAVVNAGISGSDIRDLLLKAVERRFSALRAPAVIEVLTDNGSPCIAKETQVFARQLGLKPCFTPVRSP